MGPYGSLADIFQGQLGYLTDAPDKNPELGGLNFGKCCLKAVNESLEIVDGDLQFRAGQTHLHGNISTFLQYQFPCGARFNGSSGDQPQVTVAYSWCASTCKGWARTNSKVITNWIEPLIAFIAPTIVFCFRIPRRRKIMIPRDLLPLTGKFKLPRILTLLYKIPLSSAIILLDSLLWVAVSIVVAGPMLVSGALELLLDRRLLGFLESEESETCLDSQSRAHLLMLILNGTLDLDPAWNDTKKAVHLGSGVTHEESEYVEADVAFKEVDMTTAASKSGVDPSVQIVKSQGSVDTEAQTDHASIQKGVMGDLSPAMASSASATLSLKSVPETSGSISNTAASLKIRIACLLESQPDFGPSIGISVVFYASSYFYGIEEIRQDYGNG